MEIDVLEPLGLEVEEVSNGVEALGKLSTRQYSMVLTDLEMPRMDGFELLAEMRRSPALAALPVIVATLALIIVLCPVALTPGVGGFLFLPLTLAVAFAMLATDSLDTPVVGLVARRDGERFDVAGLRARLGSARLPRSPGELGLADVFALLGGFIAGPQGLERLAGDAFGYRWLDEKHLAIGVQLLLAGQTSRSGCMSVFCRRGVVKHFALLSRWNGGPSLRVNGDTELFNIGFRTLGLPCHLAGAKVKE